MPFGQVATSTYPESVDDTVERRLAAVERRLNKKRALTRKRNLLTLGIVLTIPVVILSMFFINRFPGENFLLLILTTPVWAIVGWIFTAAPSTAYAISARTWIPSSRLARRRPTL